MGYDSFQGNRIAEQTQASEKDVTASGPPINLVDVATGGMQAAHLDPQGFMEKKARRFVDEHILHHKSADNPYAHLAAAERLEDKGDLQASCQEWSKAIDSADRISQSKAAKGLDRTRRDEAHETNPSESLHEKLNSEDVREQIIALPVTMRVEAANFYAFHGQPEQAQKLLGEATQLSTQLPPSIQRHLHLRDRLK